MLRYVATFVSFATLCRLLPLVTCGGEPPCAACEPASWRRDYAFTERQLKLRFDRNRSGTLEADEVAAARSAIGSFDVPWLPDQPYDYTSVQLPGSIRLDDLQLLDNTPPNNLLTDQGAELGRVLFYDRQLSRNNTIACASCHLQRAAFADPRPLSVGYQGGLTGRNAMSLINLRFSNINRAQPGFFWDERASSLEVQALMPIQDEIEMGMTLPELEARLTQLPYYPPLFAAAFGSTEITSQRIARAIAQFVRSLVSFHSRFDLAAEKNGTGDYTQDFADFSPLENLGKSLFFSGIGGVGELGCAHCHVPPTFNMPKAMNNGLDLYYDDPGLGAREVPPNDPFTPTNDGKFKAPSLRNIELTAPYMHDGRFQTLDEVIEHYSSGVHPHRNLAVAINDEADENQQGTSGFHFSAKQKKALVAFLKTLTDYQFVSDPRFADPFLRQGG